MSKSESEKTFDPDNFIKEESVLNTSKLFKFYQLLNDQKVSNNNIPALDTDDDEQKRHLSELKKHIENIFSEWDNICNSKDYEKIKCSEYLKYFIYGKIAEKKLNFFGIRELNNNLKELIEKKLSIINAKDCTRNFIKCAPIEVLHNKKVLYDFLEYYISINDELSKIDENTKGKYCKYIIHIFELYHKLYEEDRQWGLLQRYENELKLFRDKFTNEKELSSLKSKCNIDNSLVESFKNVKTTDFLEGNYSRGRAISTRYDNRSTKIKSEYENIIEELPSSKIYDELSKDTSGSEYKSKYCDNLKFDNDQMKTICKKMVRNIKTLSNNSEMKGLSHRDRCTYLNFWIYREISKLYPNEDKNLTDITDVYNLIDANIKINMDLIKYYSNTKNDQTAQSTLGTSSQSPSTFVNHELSKHEPCYFNYDCTFSECREMKYLYEYFKDYDKIKGNIKCEDRKKDKYIEYLTYISYLYNKHKNEKGCCSRGVEICPDYFLACDEYYNPNKIVSAMESSDIGTCNKIKNSPRPNLSEETSIDPEDENNMYIKYFTCSYVTEPTFDKKRLRCQQPEYSSLRKNKFAAVRPVYKAQTSNSQLRGKKLTINGKTINAVLISDPNAIIKGKTNSETPEHENYYTLFPEIRGAARKAYVKEAKEACKNGTPKKGMETYCERSKRYNDIINGAELQPEKLIDVGNTQNLEDIDSPADTSSINDLLQQLPVRMGAVSLASLGAVTMLFMYYKFTPFGSWLRNTIGGKKKMKHGNQIEPRISVNHQQDHMPQFSQKKRIKIAYQNS
ncbi:VIR protein [Plasmodium vivax]|uniref:VIR protein n=1 Tax=Plasmodium vivax TaxID=5855 RepID=A0A1G4HEN1_PLAVI|nr:VIR protein [Plasmodium vivax]